MAKIIHNGVKLAFEDRGAGKPAFVFVHGTACNRSFFAPQAEHFARRHREKNAWARALSSELNLKKCHRPR